MTIKNGSMSWQCYTCGKIASQRTDLKKHIEAVHLNLNLPCDMCDHISKTRHGLQIHIRACHKVMRWFVFSVCTNKNKNIILPFLFSGCDNIDDSFVQIDPMDKRSAWRCLICRKDFQNRGNVRRHVETMHFETPKFECQICFSVLKNKNSFQNHMTIIHGHKKGIRKGNFDQLSSSGNFL